jgi:hypothetical protein
MILLLIAVTAPGAAQAQSITPVWGLGAGGTKAGDFIGFSVSGSVDGQLGSFFGALGVDGSAGPPDPDGRYYRD